LHKNAFARRAGTAGGAIGSHRPLAVIRGREEGKEKVGNGNGEEGEGST